MISVPEPSPGPAVAAAADAMVGAAVDPAGWPDWFETVRAGAAGAAEGAFSRFAAPAHHPRRSAVLILFGADAGPDRPDVLLTERAAAMRSHAGQVSFPGGRIDPGDAGPVAAALREAQEETGLDPAGVVPAAQLPDLYLPASDNAVTPVLAWWACPTPVRAVSVDEVARTLRVEVAELADPANRVTVAHPSGLWSGPGFVAGDLLIWGFTAGLLDRLIHLAGWERPWDRDVRVPTPVPPSAQGVDR